MIKSRENKRKKVKMMKVTVFALFLVVCTLNVMANVKPAMGDLPVHNIDTGLDYPTIQEAIDAPETLEGHTIIADAAIYYENVVVWKDNLTIIGEDPATTVIDSNGIGEVLYIAASNVTITGFTIQNGANGVYLDPFASNTTLVGNHITNNWEYGLYLDYSSDNVFISNNITQNWRGILLWYSSNNTMYHNNFVDNTNATVYSEMSNNTWDNGYPSGGNYWSNYTGLDEDGDGIGDTPYVIDENNQDEYPLMNPWTAPDVAVLNVTTSKTVVGQGFPLSLNVTVTNQGNKIEAFNVTAYANTTVIQTESVLLTSGSSTTITFTWDTTGFVKGNYTISAYAIPLQGEKDTDDNTFIDGTVLVTIAGDVNGDGTVDVFDLSIVGQSYGYFSWQPEYNIMADINEDGVVDLRDLAIVTMNWGATDP
jgi:parallel beta-helix repeat protein